MSLKFQVKYVNIIFIRVVDLSALKYIVQGL